MKITSIFLIMFLASGILYANTWVTGPSHKVLRNEKFKVSQCYDAETKTVKLYAARNEFVSFQIVFPGPEKNVNVDAFTLSGPDGFVLKHVQRFHEYYLKHKIVSRYEAKNKVADCIRMDERRRALGAPMEYPVQMVPLHAKKHGAPFDVAKGRNEVVWVDVFVPENAPAGTYTGKVVAGATTLKVSLKVWDFTLPSVSHFPNWAYTGPEQIAWAFGKQPRDIRNMMPTFDSYFQMAHNHRICLMESIEYGMRYMKAPDRKFFDYYTGKNFKGPFAAGYGFELLPVASTVNYVGELEKQGWLNRAFYYVMDEPGSLKAYQQVLSRGLNVKKQWGGKLRTFVTEQYTPSKPSWPSLDPAIDIFCSAGTPPGKVAELESKGNVVWTYNSGWVGAIYTDAPGVAPRTQAWAGFLTGSRAWFFWDATYATDKHNRWRGKRITNPQKQTTDVWNVALNFDEATKPHRGGLYPDKWALRLNGDGLLFYSGKDVGIDGAISCFRMKGLRRGTQDFEYLYLLEKMGRRDFAVQAARQLITSATDRKASKDGQVGKHGMGYVLDPEAWDKVRIKLGKALHKIGEKRLRKKIRPYNQYPNPVGHPDYYGGKRY